MPVNELNATAVSNIAHGVASELKIELQRNTAALLAVGIEVIKAMAGHAPATPEAITQSVLKTFNDEFTKFVNPSAAARRRP
jgi:hypothetical protein